MGSLTRAAAGWFLSDRPAATIQKRKALRTSFRKETPQFIKGIIAKAAAPGAAADFAAERWPSDTKIQKSLRGVHVKAPVDPTISNDDGFPTIEHPGREFVSAIVDRSTVGRLGLRRAPLSVRMLASTSNATASFVPEGASVPVGQMSLAGQELKPFRVSALAVVSKETLLCADPSAETWIKEEIEIAAANALDAAMLDPANAGDAATPPSIFDGVSALGGTADADADLKALVNDFGGDPTRASFIARPEDWVAINGPGREFVGVRDGEVYQAPAIATRAIPTGGHLGLIDGSKIAFATGDAEFRVTDKGSIIMDDAPSSPSTHLSLFQTEAVGIAVTIRCNWRVMNPAAVSLSSGGNY